jgi:predicted RNA-binding protein with PUA-like domain
MHPKVWDKSGDGVLFEITVDREPIFSRYIDPKHNAQDRKWHDFEIDLAPYAGQTVEISLLTAPDNRRGTDTSFDWAGWSDPRIVVGRDPRIAYDFIDNLGKASSVYANVDVGSSLLARNRRRVLIQHPVAEGHPAELAYGGVPVPAGAFMQFGIGMQREVWDKGGDGVRFEVMVDGERVFSEYIDPKHSEQDRKWHDFKVSLLEYADRQVDITFLVDPNETYAWDWAVWADPQIAVVDVPPP